MFILHQTSVKMAVLLHKQAKVPFIMIIAVYTVKPVIRVDFLFFLFGFSLDSL